MANEVPIRLVDAQAFQVPTDGPEVDGTIDGDSTMMVVAWVGAA